VRARRVTAFSLVLASLAVVSTIFGYVKLQESKETRALAETTRADAETLVGYLLEDFHAELEPVGRLDMIGELASRCGQAVVDQVKAAVGTHDKTEITSLK